METKAWGYATAWVVTATLFIAPSGAARAADRTDATGADEEGVNVVVTVSARRREESAQEVPVGISVLSSAMLDSAGARSIGDAAQLAPAVQFYSSNPRNSAITIRGLGSPFGLTNDGIEPGVGIYVDQVYYARP